VTLATELLGRVVRDTDMRRLIVERSRPDWGAMVLDPAGRAHSNVWRAAVVALGHLIVPPSEADVSAGSDQSMLDAAAVLLGATLASTEAALSVAETIAARSTSSSVSLLALTAALRLTLGRVMTVVG
jgi:hypothetical protein